MLREQMPNELEPIIVSRLCDLNWYAIFYSAYKNLGEYREIRVVDVINERTVSFLVRGVKNGDGVNTEFVEFSSGSDKKLLRRQFTTPTRDMEQHGFVVLSKQP